MSRKKTYGIVEFVLSRLNAYHHAKWLGQSATRTQGGMIADSMPPTILKNTSSATSHKAMVSTKRSHIPLQILAGFIFTALVKKVQNPQ
jgi:hypothetical protein